MSESYQRGSIRRIKRASGRQVWEWRFRIKGTMRQETFSVDEFPTQKVLWPHLETRIRLLNQGESVPVPRAVKMGQLITKYIAEYLSELAKSTRDTDGSMLRVHFEPHWSDTLIADVHPDDVQKWIKTLTGADGKPLSAASKGRARRLMKQLIDRAMFWRFIPVGENPMKLVQVRGSSKRQKSIVIITIEQVNQLIEALPMPYSLMVLVSASLGLRVEEVIPLQWEDFDFAAKTVTIKRAYTHSELKEPKTDASWSTLPLEGTLLDVLKANRPEDGLWVFPSPVTGGCMSADTILQKKIKPAVTELGLPHIGWHTFRHSYKSWQGKSKATPSELKDMMRHADIMSAGAKLGHSAPRERCALAE